MSCWAAHGNRLTIAICLAGLVAFFPRLAADDELQYARLVFPTPRTTTLPTEVTVAPLPAIDKLVSYVSPTTVALVSRLREGPVDLGEFTSRRITTRVSKAVERQASFEREFGIPERSKSPVKATLQTLKYGVDTSIFVAMEAENSVEDVVNIAYDFGRSRVMSRGEARRERKLSRAPVLESDIDVSPLKGEAYVGVRLVIPWRD